jgi:hypothetical protein
MKVEIEFECSWHTPGAKWVHGCEYYAIVATAIVPDDMNVDDVEEWQIAEWCNDEENGCSWLLE